MRHFSALALAALAGTIAMAGCANLPGLGGLLGGNQSGMESPAATPLASASISTPVALQLSPLDPKKRSQFISLVWQLALPLDSVKYQKCLLDSDASTAKVSVDDSIWDTGKVLKSKYLGSVTSFLKGIDYLPGTGGKTSLVVSTESVTPVAFGTWNGQNVFYVDPVANLYTYNNLQNTLTKRVSKNAPIAIAMAKQFVSSFPSMPEVDTLVFSVVYGERDFVNEASYLSHGEVALFAIPVSVARDYASDNITAQALVSKSKVYVVPGGTFDWQLIDVDMSLVN